MRGIAIAGLVCIGSAFLAGTAVADANVAAFRADCAEPRIQGNWELQAAACLILIQHAADDDERAYAHYERGNALEELNENRDAIEHYNQAIEMKPDYVDAIVNRGLTYRRMDDIDKARENYDLAISLDPDHEPARVNRSKVAIMEERYADAIADLDHVLLRNPEFPVALNNRAQAHEQLGNFEKALADYGSAIRIWPENSYLRVNRAITYLDLDRVDDALSDLHAALKLDPDNASAHDHLSEIFGSEEYGIVDQEKSFQHAREYARLRSDDAQGHYRVALIATRLGDTAQAIAAHERIITDFFFYRPSYQEALVAKGFLDEDHENAWDDASRRALKQCVEAGCIPFDD
ncbi:tetratricopeptide repeat protein [Minwuia sp.]|uniref:tetratricopeptide repeat protein n=1 Tax=Minwuia sp. TaxID=2493630 RepID=UPI003A8ED44B